MNITGLLQDYLNKYGEKYQVCLKKDLNKIPAKNVAFDSYEIPRPNDDSVGQSLNIVGQVIYADYESHEFISLIKVGKVGSNEAFVVAKIVDNRIYVAGYFKEGIINQHIAEKALEIVKKRVTHP